MIRKYCNVTPKIAESAYIDETALIIGDVVIGDESSVWPFVVIRGDMNFIRIGAQTNIQDHTMIHVELGKYETIVGDRVTVGHRVTLHGCRIGNRCLIGMGAIILNNVEVGEGSIIAAGTVVPENTVIPPGSVVMGIPGVVRRKTTEKDLKRIDQGIEAYLDAMKINLSERRGCVNPVRGFATGAD